MDRKLENMRFRATMPPRLPPGTLIVNGDLNGTGALAFAQEIAADGGAVIATDVTGKVEVGDEGLPVEVMTRPAPRSNN